MIKSQYNYLRLLSRKLINHNIYHTFNTVQLYDKKVIQEINMNRPDLEYSNLKAVYINCTLEKAA